MSVYDAYEHLLIEEVEEGILKVTMHSPGRLNAAHAGMHTELARIWKDIDEDPNVNVAILTGSGGVFSAGGDLDLVKDMSENFDVLTRVWKEARDLVYNVINCSKPIVSAMEGPAVGAGLAAGLLADISIAAKDARIIDGHTRLGVAAGDHAAIVWPLLCGMAKSKYHLMLCEQVTGEEAERMGLVSLTVDAGDVQDRALEVARKLNRGSKTALRWTKYALNNWLRMAGPTFDASLALEFMGFNGPDIREGRASVLEKRRPQFGAPAETR
ncbi:enoyl-CoA hydratase/isomerase family protein [Arthrobacter koreensis]|jgi:enoyl-CoA hydratase|uniref:Enoyl-CoA hydratase/isomerase family protein n=1 Tax=Arthrobacter koreensis TaxID=199136 RepID=A0ABY6FRF1_9MICC|nr:enoyl-CoA hydratase/isomerase family protein [Arthrobacter koreensis]MDF2496871.1 echA8 9 [Arthrobacter koreensis]UYB35617.1 enoyl-CoA hydratase/isomerase family protein [Arthrobacter koreensis]